MTNGHLAGMDSAEDGTSTSGRGCVTRAARRRIREDGPLQPDGLRPVKRGGAGDAYLQPRLSMSYEDQEMISVQASVQASQ